MCTRLTVIRSSSEEGFFHLKVPACPRFVRSRRRKMGWSPPWGSLPGDNQTVPHRDLLSCNLRKKNNANSSNNSNPVLTAEETLVVTLLYNIECHRQLSWQHNERSQQASWFWNTAIFDYSGSYGVRFRPLVMEKKNKKTSQLLTFIHKNKIWNPSGTIKKTNHMVFHLFWGWGLTPCNPHGRNWRKFPVHVAYAKQQCRRSKWHLWNSDEQVNTASHDHSYTHFTSFLFIEWARVPNPS